MLIFLLSLATFSQAVIALLVFLRGSKSLTNVLFACISWSLIGWSVTNYIAAAGIQNASTIFPIRLVIFFVILQNTFFLLFAHTFPGPKLNIRKVIYIPFIIYSVIVAIDSLSPFLFSKVIIENGQANPVAMPGIILFLIHAIVSISLALKKLILSYLSSRGVLRSQLSYLLTGSFILWVIVPITNLVVTLAFHTTVFIRFSSIYTFVFSSLMAVVIVRHRFLDIRAVLARSLAFVLLLATMAAIYFGSLLSLSNLVFNGASGSLKERLISAGIAIFLALTFQPLRRLFERITNRIFFKDRYDVQAVLDNLSKILVSEIELGEILHKSLAQICSEMSIDFGQLIIFNNETVYRMEHYGKLPKRLIVAPQLRKLNHSMLVAEDLQRGERKVIMEDHGIRVSAMLRTRDELVGYLLLGDKLSGEIYTLQDIELLQIIAKELAVAAQNAKAYAEIQEFNLTLQERINHATNRLRVANRHLKELDQAKDEFISMASHQLRTPLTTIKGYLSMILEGDAGSITPTQRQFTGYAFEGADRMVNLIADLLNVSRLSAGRFMIDTRPSDLNAIMSDEVRQLQSHATAKNLKLVYFEPKRPLPLIELDDNKTRQVIMNFIDNAIYYTKTGSITVSLAKVGDQARVLVQDTGIGVPLKARKKLFSKFYRADNAQTVRPDGTGLGLYLAKRVVEDQGGTIIFESVEGKGSTFGFDLPLKTVTDKSHSQKVSSA